MKRWPRILLIASTLVLSWLAMMLVHELGHVLAAWLTGGSVVRVLLHPLAFSRTDLAANPRPLIVAWAGPLVGVALPLALWCLARGLCLPGWYVLRFLAGFCLIANGAYLAFGVFDRAGDAGDLLRYGAAPWQLWTFGTVTIPLGLLLWQRLGPHFGLGPSSRRFSPVVAVGTAVAAGGIVLVELLTCLV